MNRDEHSWADPGSEQPEMPQDREPAGGSATARPRTWGTFAGVALAGLLAGGLGATMVQANESDSAPVGSGESRVGRDHDSGRLPSGGLENADFEDDHQGIEDDDFDDDHGGFEDDREDREDD